MRLDASGNLLVGRTSAGAAATDHGFRLFQTGQIYVYSSSSGNADVWRGYNSSGTNTSAIDADGDYIDLSDAKYKENIAPSERGLSDLLNINVVSFDWITTGVRQSSGLIAQELQGVIPELINEQSDTGDKRIKGSRFYPILIKALQEQQAMIETLQAQVAELQGAN